MSRTSERRKAKGDGIVEGRERGGAGSGAAVLLLTAAGVWLGTRLEDRILPALTPLLLAAAGAWLVSPSADAVSRAFRVRRKTGGAVWAVLLCGLTLWLTGLLGGRLTAELIRVLEALPGWIGTAAEEAEALLGRLWERLRPDRSIPAMEGNGGREGLFGALMVRAATTLAERAAAVLGRMMQGFPGGILSLAAGAVAFVWLTADPDGAWEALAGLIPSSSGGLREKAERFRERMRRAGDAMGRYLRAYLTLTAVTFAELLPGLWLLGTENAPAAAFLIAAVDLLPVLGCGTVLVPWAAASFLAGNGGRGIGLLLLLAAVWVTRQILEPRLVGKAAGVHPFLALTAGYLGLRLFGGTGMLLSAVLLCSLSAEKEKGP